MYRFLHERRGQAYVEFVMILPVLLILLAAVIFFGRILYLKIAIDMASYNGIRTAVEALDHGAAVHQGYTAARNTLAGFHIHAGAAQIAVTSTGAWQRGQHACCHVTYNVGVGNIPFLGAFFPQENILMGSTTCSRVAPLRAGW